jgi:hypothetical protein
MIRGKLDEHKIINECRDILSRMNCMLEVLLRLKQAHEKKKNKKINI